MDEETVRGLAKVVEDSLQTSVGVKWLSATHQKLLDDCRKGSFNSERALQVYTIAIERSLMATSGVTVMRAMRWAGVTEKMAGELVEQFKQATDATDQRPPRRGIWRKIVGA